MSEDKSKYTINFIGFEESDIESIKDLVDEFAKEFLPLENTLYVLKDLCLNSIYCECHLKAEYLVEKATVDVPIDPENQSDYRANRELVEDHSAYEKMKEDALNQRTFSNLVCEYTTDFEPEAPLKIIGGQHRLKAIEEAYERGINVYHGIKVYFELSPDQRLDVQLISNTNIVVSPDLLDRMYETLSGPNLRDWTQKVGLLEGNSDFTDKKQKGKQISVRLVRTFILNYYNGKKIDARNFDNEKTIPQLASTGGYDQDWEELKQKEPNWYKDEMLIEAGRNYAKLIEAQTNYFKTKKNISAEFSEKATNYAVLSAWAFVAGILCTNKTRLKRLYNLKDTKNKDPLNTAILAKCRHKSDPENYRGLGCRTEPKERGRFVELFYLIAEKGEGVSKPLADLAVKKYHAKLAMLEVKEAEEKTK